MSSSPALYAWYGRFRSAPQWCRPDPSPNPVTFRAGWFTTRSTSTARGVGDEVPALKHPEVHVMSEAEFYAKDPAEVGLDPAKVAAFLERAEREVKEGLLPSCQVALARNG